MIFLKRIFNFLKRLFVRKSGKVAITSKPTEASRLISRLPIKVPIEHPEQRVFESSIAGPEYFYPRMSRDLIELHGPLILVEYLEHYPSFRIRFTYEDGTVINSDERSGQYDIHFLSLGYIGEGPRYAKAFLAAAGVDLSMDEIEDIKPGDVIHCKKAY